MIRAFLAVASVFSTLAAAQSAPPLQFADLGDCKLESGETIHGCRVAYRTLGKLNAGKSNAILAPTWFTGSSEELAGQFGPEGLADPARYFVVVVDALGNGVSSSPSNSAAQPRMKFPRFTIRDMVNSEYRLLTEKLGISHLHAVMGVSMGGMQTFQWIAAYPDFMSKAVPIVGSPRLTSYDLLLWRSEESAIVESKDWNGGNYRAKPKLDAVIEIQTLALTTPDYRVRETAPAAFPKFLSGIDQEGLSRMDANDWLSQLRAMMSLDIYKPFGESIARAAAAVKAKVFVVASMRDHMVNPTPAVEFGGAIHAEILRLQSDCGHLATGCDSATVAPKVREFLDR